MAKPNPTGPSFPGNKYANILDKNLNTYPFIIHQSALGYHSSVGLWYVSFHSKNLSVNKFSELNFFALIRAQFNWNYSFSQFFVFILCKKSNIFLFKLNKPVCMKKKTFSFVDKFFRFIFRFIVLFFLNIGWSFVHHQLK